MKAIKIILKTVLLISLAIHGLLSAIVPANADVMTGVSTSCFPETGKPETYGSLTIDHSHASDGFIIVKSSKSSQNLKIAISFDGTAKIHYNLNTDGNEEIIPLQYGSGRYTASLYRQISGPKYQKDGEISFTVKMKDKLGYTLYPNQWVNYTAETAAVQYADELCADLTDEYEITMAVYKFMGKNFSYDWIKAGDVKAGTLKDILPDIDGSWETRTGICHDMAAIMCAMLRSQGIHAQLVIGTCSGTPHAWVTVYYHSVDGNLKSLSLDPTYRCNATAKAGYKAERYY